MNLLFASKGVDAWTDASWCGVVDTIFDVLKFDGGDCSADRSDDVVLSKVGIDGYVGSSELVLSPLKCFAAVEFGDSSLNSFNFGLLGHVDVFGDCDGSQDPQKDKDSDHLNQGKPLAILLCVGCVIFHFLDLLPDSVVRFIESSWINCS